MRSLRLLPSLALAIGMLALTGTALANPGITRESGKGGGDTCKSCHGNATNQPTFDVSLPDAVMANASVLVTLKINGVAGQSLTSFDAAFDVDAVVTPGTGTRVGDSANEIIATTPMTGQNGTYTFTVKIPNRNGPLSLWIAGLSANGNGKMDGDNFGALIVSSTISGSDAGAANTPPPPDPTTDTGSGATSSGVDAGPPVIIANPILPDGDPGCQSAPGHAPDLLWIAGVGAVVVGLGRRASRGREKRRR